MVTDAETGAKKGAKAERYDLIPPNPLRELALHYGLNSEEHGGKYPSRNWEKGYSWRLSFAAMLRHAFAIARGEWLDPDSPDGKRPHAAAIAWHAFALMEYRNTHPEKNDLHPALTASDPLGNYSGVVPTAAPTLFCGRCGLVISPLALYAHHDTLGAVHTLCL